jgi:hypothetical protein
VMLGAVARCLDEVRKHALQLTLAG